MASVAERLAVAFPGFGSEEVKGVLSAQGDDVLAAAAVLAAKDVDVEAVSPRRQSSALKNLVEMTEADPPEDVLPNAASMLLGATNVVLDETVLLRDGKAASSITDTISSIVSSAAGVVFLVKWSNPTLVAAAVEAAKVATIRRLRVSVVLSFTEGTQLAPPVGLCKDDLTMASDGIEDAFVDVAEKLAAMHPFYFVFGDNLEAYAATQPDNAASLYSAISRAGAAVHAISRFTKVSGGFSYNTLADDRDAVSTVISSLRAEVDLLCCMASIASLDSLLPTHFSALEDVLGPDDDVILHLTFTGLESDAAAFVERLPKLVGPVSPFATTLVTNNVSSLLSSFGALYAAQCLAVGHVASTSASSTNTKMPARLDMFSASRASSMPVMANQPSGFAESPNQPVHGTLASIGMGGIVASQSQTLNRMSMPSGMSDPPQADLVVSMSSASLTMRPSSTGSARPVMAAAPIRVNSLSSPLLDPAGVKLLSTPRPPMPVAANEVEAILLDRCRVAIEQRVHFERLKATGIAEALIARISRNATKQIMKELLHLGQVSARDAPALAGYYDKHKLNALVIGVIDRITLAVIDDTETLNAMIAKYSETWNAPMAQVAQDQGPREYMEDRFTCVPYVNELLGIESNERLSLFLVADGHGGEEVAEYIARHLCVNIFRSPLYPADIKKAMRDGFLKTNDGYEELVKRTTREHGPGATCVAAIVRGKEVHVAWVGDSEATLYSSKSDANKMVKIHKVSSSSEKKRIVAAGGFVKTVRGLARVNGVLAVSRAFGNLSLKPFIVAEPDFSNATLKNDDGYLVLACDGLYESMDHSGVGSFVKDYVKKNNGSFAGAAEALCARARTKGSTDNITILLVRFNSS